MMAAAQEPRALVAEREIEREVRRLFPRLSEGEAYVAPMPDGGYGLFVARNRWHAPIARIEAPAWRAIERRDFVELASEARWRPSSAGLAYWRRLGAGADPFRAQHQLSTVKQVGDVAVDFNEGESPLGWLRRRKGADGQPLVSSTQFEAGERLRRDFTLSSMTPRLTTDWSAAMTADSGGRRPRDPSDVTDRALAARERLARALRAVGPKLSDLALAVCCHLQGLEAAEQDFGWPRRSAKVVLQIALDRLAMHYGLDEENGRQP
ncbi:DUF6456 domain-containing protein [Parvibaculum sedimenti]|nr:DUF6456 domain-containing protein [Parvibaculum sedimenti]